MWFLLGTTLTASFFDSLNPSAIAQQMLLQAMVKKKRHIWFFICGIGTANLIMGLAIYYGIATWVSKFLTKIVNAYPLYVYGAAGIVVPALPYLLSFAAGAMLYVVVEELIPEMSQGQHSNVGTVFFAVGFSVMMVLDVALG